MGGGDGGALPRVVLTLGGDVLDERDEATGAAVRLEGLRRQQRYKLGAPYVHGRERDVCDTGVDAGGVVGEHHSGHPEGMQVRVSIIFSVAKYVH